MKCGSVGTCRVMTMGWACVTVIFVLDLDAGGFLGLESVPFSNGHVSGHVCTRTHVFHGVQEIEIWGAIKS